MLLLSNYTVCSVSTYPLTIKTPFFFACSNDDYKNELPQQKKL